MRHTLPVVIALFIVLPLSAQDAARPYELGDVDTRPAVQNRAEFTAALAALYPAALRDSAIGGTAQVSFVIGADGAVREAAAVDATRPEFGAAAVEAVGVLRFEPATVGGEPVAVRVTQPVEWVVDSATAAAGPTLAKTPLAAASEYAVPGPGAFGRRAVEEFPVLINSYEVPSILAREYPAALRNTGMRARVMARFRVDERGYPGEVGIVSSTDFQFEEPTRRAVRQFRFRPARVNGRAVSVWVALPVEWSPVR